MDVYLREQGLYRFGPFSLDPVRRSLTRDGTRIKLAERLFDALLYLVANQGRLVEREELLQAVWVGRAVEPNNVAQAIFALRKILKAAGGTDGYIITVPSRGFRFAEPVVFEPAQAEPLAEPMPTASTQRRAAPPAEQFGARGVVSLVLATLALVVACASIVLWQRVPPTANTTAPDVAFAPPAHSVAVLAFDNLSGDPGQTYLSDGLADQLIDSLTQISAIQVAARTSAFSFRGSRVTVAQIARALNVGAVLAGSVRRSGARVAVTAQLTNALTGFNMWSRTYDRDQGDLAGVSADLALAVAVSLQGALPGGEAAKLTLGGTAVAAAFDVYLHGIKLQAAANGEADYRAAVADFDAAVRQDRGFALAYAERANALSHIGVMAATSDHAARREIFARALADADRAIALAPGLGRAHSVRGIVLDWGFLDWDAGAAEQAEARALAPGSAVTETNFATAEAALGHLDLAVAAARLACQLDPLSSDAWGGLARDLYLSRYYGETLEALRRSKALSTAFSPQFVTTLGFTALMRGDLAGALQAASPGTYVGQMMVLAVVYAKQGRQAEFAAEISKLYGLIGDDGAYNYAQIYAQAGRYDDALDWLEKAVAFEDAGLVDVRVDPMLDPLRAMPRFNTILRRVTQGGLALNPTVTVNKNLDAHATLH
jgi:TolB-like protein/DNA-binding winged helix-turn-helix (wHTH) protein